MLGGLMIKMKMMKRGMLFISFWLCESVIDFLVVVH